MDRESVKDTIVYYLTEHCNGMEIHEAMLFVADWHIEQIKLAEQRGRIEIADKFKKELPVGVFDSTPYLELLYDKIIQENTIETKEES